MDCTGPKLIASEQHFTHILAEFKADLVEGVATDVQLCTDFGGVLAVHKCLATQLSPLLKSLLDNQSCKISSVIILPDTEIRDINNLVQFLYTGKCSVPDKRSLVAVEELILRLCIFERTLESSGSNIQEDNLKDISLSSDHDCCSTGSEFSWQRSRAEKESSTKEDVDQRNKDPIEKINEGGVLKENTEGVEKRNKEDGDETIKTAVYKRNMTAVYKRNKTAVCKRIKSDVYMRKIEAVEERNKEAVENEYYSSRHCFRNYLQEVTDSFQANDGEICESNIDLIYLSDSSSEYFYSAETTLLDDDVNNNTNNNEVVMLSDTSSENVINYVNTEEDGRTSNSDTVTASYGSENDVGNHDDEKEVVKSVILPGREDHCKVNMKDVADKPLQCSTHWDRSSSTKTLCAGDVSKAINDFNLVKYLNYNRDESWSGNPIESTTDAGNCSTDVPVINGLVVPEALYSRKAVHGRNSLPWDVVGVDYRDCDTDWIGIKSRRHLMDLNCSTTGEKEFFSRWNSWLLKHGAGSGGNSIHLSEVLNRFIAAEGQSIMKDGLYRQFMLHLVTLQQMHLIDSEQLFHLSRTIQILPELMS